MAEIEHVYGPNGELRTAVRIGPNTLIEFGDSNSNKGGGTGGSCFGILVLIIALLPLTISSLIAASISSLVLMGIVKVNEPTLPHPKFSKAFKVTFFTTILFQIILTMLYMVFMWMWTNGILTPELQKSASGIDEKEASRILVSSLIRSTIIVAIISTIIAAFYLKKKISGYPSFRGLAGYLKSFLFTLIILLPLIITSNLLVASGYFLIGNGVGISDQLNMAHKFIDNLMLYGKIF